MDQLLVPEVKGISSSLDRVNQLSNRFLKNSFCQPNANCIFTVHVLYSIQPVTNEEIQFNIVSAERFLADEQSWFGLQWEKSTLSANVTVPGLKGRQFRMEMSACPESSSWTPVGPTV